jgi:hypothetical protein
MFHDSSDDDDDDDDDDDGNDDDDDDDDEYGSVSGSSFGFSEHDPFMIQMLQQCHTGGDRISIIRNLQKKKGNILVCQQTVLS